VDRLSEKRNAFDPAEEILADLIRASEPVVVTPARKQRVLNRVLLRETTRRRARSRLLRPVFVLGVISLAGATAAATIGRRAWIEGRAQTNARPVDPVALAARPRHAHPKPVVPVAANETADQLLDEPEAAAPAPSRPTPRTLRRPAHVASRAHAARSSEDPSRVFDAIQALRTDRDPARASRLLAEYLARYPHGALAEEAVALSIEAAAARHSPSAATFAERYLREYPRGRFRHTAEQALEHTPN
jgi:type IV secretory pathway VirB10-like protein